MIDEREYFIDGERVTRLRVNRDRSDYILDMMRMQRNPAFQLRERLFRAVEYDIAAKGEKMLIDNIVEAIRRGIGEKETLELKRLNKEEGRRLDIVMPDEVAKAVIGYEKVYAKKKVVVKKLKLGKKN